MLRSVITVITTAAVLLAGTSYADMPSPYIFGDKEKSSRLAANFTLSPSTDEAQALNFTVSSRLPGKCSYTFALMSGDVPEILEQDEVKVRPPKYTHYFSFGTPKEGRTLHYIVRASFIADDTMRQRKPAEFKKSLTVRNIDGVTYAFIRD